MDRQTVSGSGSPWERACANQVWNWVSGLGEREERERVDCLYCGAWCVVVSWPAGATVGIRRVSFGVWRDMERGERKEDGVQINLSAGGWWAVVVIFRDE